MDAALMLIEYSDGFRAALLHGQGSGNLISGWAYAALVDGEIEATAFNGSQAPNYGGFSYMNLNIELMFETKTASLTTSRSYLKRPPTTFIIMGL
jgi:hypothetical protein